MSRAKHTNPTYLLAGAAVLLGGALSTATAGAQEGTEGGAEAPAAAPPAESLGKAPFPRISDSEETIYAVQRKAFLINKKIELSLMPTASFTDRFVQTFGAAASATYHVAENFGIEVFGGYFFPDESGLTDELLTAEDGRGNTLKLRPEIAKLTQMLWAAGIGAQWSPIYGKVEIFDTSLGNFAFYVSAGLGVGQTRVECTPSQRLDEAEFGAGVTCPPPPPDVGEVVYEPSRTQVMGTVAGGVRFYFSNQVGLKLEVKDWIFPARVFRPDSNELTQRFTGAIRNNLFFQLGVSFLFGGEDN